ncbi:hypothetical protein CRUP_015879 [Coryphaenoides rupestris]|nr:hypothetical protein CRUP_015879 [Coryphaenoides rupestris]
MAAKTYSSGLIECFLLPITSCVWTRAADQDNVGDKIDATGTGRGEERRGEERREETRGEERSRGGVANADTVPAAVPRGKPLPLDVICSQMEKHGVNTSPLGGRAPPGSPEDERRRGSRGGGGGGQQGGRGRGKEEDGDEEDKEEEDKEEEEDREGEEEEEGEGGSGYT